MNVTSVPVQGIAIVVCVAARNVSEHGVIHRMEDRENWGRGFVAAAAAVVKQFGGRGSDGRLQRECVAKWRGLRVYFWDLIN